MTQPRTYKSDPRTGPQRIWITEHALDRWQERVDPAGSRETALTAITRLAALGTRLRRPRRWMEIHDPAACCVVCPEFPRIAIVVVGRHAVTVITKPTATGRRRPRWPMRPRHARLQRAEHFNPRSLRGLEAIADV